MRVASIQMRNFRPFIDSGPIPLTSVNVLIGANNSGKSSVLRGLHLLQHGLNDIFGDVRVGSNEALINIELLIDHPTPWSTAKGFGKAVFTCQLNTTDRRNGSINIQINDRGTTIVGDSRLPNIEPDHFVVPYLSKRKTVTYNEDIRELNVKAIEPDVRNLAAKLSRLANPDFPFHSVYAEACKSILGFVVTAIPSQNGQRPGIYLPSGASVPIEQMGEGVPNIVHFLTSLATSKNKLFLVEEPENDLHPTALKALLELIIESSSSNQFVVSTHSNIVVRNLCGIPDSQLLRVSSSPGVLPTESRIETVRQTPEARIAVLQELGYAFSDLDFWDGWLILEESSAERIIRDYLIPWFVPKLARIRTLSAGGVDRVEPVLDDFLRLVLFTHLQPAYKDRTWVRVDNDKRGASIITDLRRKYNDWPEDRFNTFQADQFEHYYPAVFADAVRDVLAIENRQDRRVAKRELLAQVMKWLDEDTQRGREAIQASAANIIEDLKKIESQITI